MKEQRMLRYTARLPTASSRVAVMIASGLLVLMLEPVARAETPSCLSYSATIVGTSGDDVLVGAGNADVIYGGGGNDFMRGRGGYDTICGGSGRDLIYAGPKNDVVIGDSGRDEIHGGAGTDNILGDPGNDTIDGGEDGAAVYYSGSPGIWPGATSSVTVDLSQGLATGDASVGTDTLHAIWGATGSIYDDTLIGDNSSFNRLDGWDGNDTIWGGGSDVTIDQVIGGPGDDNLNVQDGGPDDYIGGLSGTDTCAYDEGDRPEDCEIIG
jgi:Ca2+-binding RTX toxin-like protein